MRRWLSHIGVVPAVLLVSACTGLVGGPSGNRNGDHPNVNVQGVTVGTGYLRRLTRTQYLNTVSDLFGKAITVSSTLPSDDGTVGYEVGKVVSESGAEGYFDAAAEIAESVTADVNTLLPCAANMDDACIDGFITSFGQRAFRRPLTAEEAAEWKAAYVTGRDAYGVREGVQLVIQAALSSPSFVYLVEADPAGAKTGDVVRLGAYEVASRLSYMAWNSAPDDELLQAAAEGRLDTKEGIEDELDRLLSNTDKAKRGLRDFYEQWLLVNRLPGVQRDANSGYSPALAAALTDAFDHYVDDVVWNQNGTVSDLLRSDFTYASSTLGPVLGDVGTLSDTMQRMDHVPNRVGILAQPAVLVATANGMQSDPIHRGKFVRERILCEQLVAKPDQATIDAALAKQPLREVPSGSSPRAFGEARIEQPYCAGCHKLMDPIGFGFENFDGLGRFNASTTDSPVDPSGEVVGGSAAGKFDNFEGLVNHLADSQAVADCVATQYFRYAVGRYESNDDVPSVKQVRAAQAADGNAVLAVLRGVATSDAFLHRRISAEPKEP